MRDELVNQYKNCGITKVVGIESRGFILAPAIAIELGAGFVPIRKHNKLPAETVSVTYKKEYGDDTIQIHKDALLPDDVVLIHDDILATGGSMEAAIELVKKLGVKKIYVNCIIELEGLNGMKYLEGKAEDIECLLKIEVDE
jgi:adenine phosphoribosyltransferase